MNHDGELDLVELSSLLLKLTGRAPGHAELELSLRELDSDASGTVSLDELLSWWSRKKREETLAVHEAVVSEAPAPAPKPAKLFEHKTEEEKDADALQRKDSNIKSNLKNYGLPQFI